MNLYNINRKNNIILNLLQRSSMSKLGFTTLKNERKNYDLKHFISNTNLQLLFNKKIVDE